VHGRPHHHSGTAAESQWRPAPQPSGQWTQAPNQGVLMRLHGAHRTRGNRKELPRWGAAPQGAPQGGRSTATAAAAGRAAAVSESGAATTGTTVSNGHRLLRHRISKPGVQLRSWVHQQVNSLRQSAAKRPGTARWWQRSVYAGAAWGAVENNSTADGDPVKPISKH